MSDNKAYLILSYSLYLSSGFVCVSNPRGQSHAAVKRKKQIISHNVHNFIYSAFRAMSNRMHYGLQQATDEKSTP